MSVNFPEFTHPPIDIHSHFNHGSPFDCPEKPIHLRGLEFLKSEYDRFGISHVGMSTYASCLKNPECVAEENEYLHNFIQNNDWAFQWVVIDPRQKETYRQAEQMLSHPKVLGIKIHPTYHGYSIIDYADELFSFADKFHTTILMHPQEILKMPEFADKYPNMKLIIAHLSSMDHIEAVAMAKNSNIYLDTSAGGVSINNIIEYAVSRIGSEKILFGSDTYSLAFSYPRIAMSSLPKTDKENILWRNAITLFPKSFKEN